jgi:pimeloyl-ACP methyl ester carboxylesterase
MSGPFLSDDVVGVGGLDAPPIIMGHSFGGLITQLLLDRGLGASAVAISPAQIQGVYILPLAQAKVASVALKNPANRHRTQMLHASRWSAMVVPLPFADGELVERAGQAEVWREGCLEPGRPSRIGRRQDRPR